MGTLLEFPSQQAQGLAFLDRQIRQLLLAKGADDDLVEFAATELTRIYSRISESEQYSIGIQLPPGLDEHDRNALQVEINAGLETIRGENHGLMVELVAQLVLTKVQLFELSRR
ncbi:hypothetical protein BST95_18615 [Halioglobus japonicus]|uniref:Uncharacterized protein n=1 Tax=Halioglobus japonicus TaxID=930805 RepID=A0AAP8MBF7_9GAMM|nr:hypothetical protein [Halioglobus japonicus]AQA19958.1 hypothetical protein BST95_18615 [Halioglobus japonicus]PLW84574.1 hypothetical protein C0029_18325 [Halioglobus japonicus]GHD22997.1 hypothetical protein GCM10007052_35170 [Halioglobus japonicus]